MKSFSQLYCALDASTSTTSKTEALVHYFQSAESADAAWAVYFLAGGRPRQTVPTRLLRAAAIRQAAIPEWLFEECYQTVGDLAETISLVLAPPTRSSGLGLAQWIESRLLTLRGAAPEVAMDALASYWDELDGPGRFLLTKLIGGGFRVGVSKLLVTRALAQCAGVDAKIVAQRLMGYTDLHHLPTATDYECLIAPWADEDAADPNQRARGGQPYPFFLAHALPSGAALELEDLGLPERWLIEWKYDGIRGQLVRRDAKAWLWSRGEELVNERFLELVAIQTRLGDGCVLDGEILVWEGDRPGTFALLQKRIGRKNLTPKVLREAPVCFIAYDLLEMGHQDLRHRPLCERRALLEQVVATASHPKLLLSPRVTAPSWSELARLQATARERGVEGFMLKELDSAYGVGRTKEGGVWWKWKIDPLTADAVLIYAQRGHGRRASLYTDFTFAVWDRPSGTAGRALVPFAKAYSGLTDAEMKQVDAIVRKTTIEKFGPVRSVVPTMVFELGFEGIQRSPRHKSGLAVRFPRMLRLRPDKAIEDADCLTDLESLLA